jgi:hypothetical protein
MLRWPLPALLTWALAWGLAMALRQAPAPLWAVLLLPTALGLAISFWPRVAGTVWRRLWVVGGFPLSVLVLALGQGAALPAWLWLVLLGLLLLAYPVHAWRDAPVFPTPHDALLGLPAQVLLPPGAKVLDAGCGLGDGLIALHAAYPEARLDGTEWSWLWRQVAAWRCPWARVRRGDMWADDWAACDLVYLFQRPETMPRALEKARREMRPGTWLVSLEFEGREADGRPWPAHARLALEGGRPIWVYRIA